MKKIKEILSENPKIEIVNDDCLNYLKELLDNSIDCVITSPPYYSLRNYQVEGQIGLEPTFEEYQNKLLEIFKEIKRILKESGSFWLNMGDVYCSHSAGNTYISKANKGFDMVFVRKIKMNEGAKSFVSVGGFQGEQFKKNPQKWQATIIGKKKAQIGNLPDKCMMMMPERIALKMIDEQGWILRQKIIWAKQILLNKEKRTIGSVMPTSVKDRFNMSWEYLYHFVKNKKYYFDLDSVRIPPQTFENRPYGIIREREFGYDTEYPEVRNPMVFNYRVRDAERKAGQPQFRASEEEIRKYKTNPDPRGSDKGGLGIRNWQKETEEGYKMGSVDPHRAALRGGLKYYRGKFLNHPEAEMFGSPRARNTRKVKENQECKIRNPERSIGLLGKNIPTIWQINPEPHNFKKELGVLGYKVKDNLTKEQQNYLIKELDRLKII